MQGSNRAFDEGVARAKKKRLCRTSSVGKSWGSAGEWRGSQSIGWKADVVQRQHGLGECRVEGRFVATEDEVQKQGEATMESKSMWVASPLPCQASDAQ